MEAQLNLGEKNIDLQKAWVERDDVASSLQWSFVDASLEST